jgi:acid-sensing ion channel, other
VKRYRIVSHIISENTSYPLSVRESRSGFFSIIRKFLLTFKSDRLLYTKHHETFNYEGVNYLIHNPFEMFSRDSKLHQTIANHSITVYLNPVKTIIDEALETYEPQRRGCYLKGEKLLKFFKIFTKNNCRSECLANKTLAVCGCAQFFMVRDVSTRVCGVNDMKCYKKVEKESQSPNWCDCLIECGEIEYKTETVQMEYIR